ncbi:MAG: NAD(P)-dependent oxidoreductase [Deltaproteobacteria bacterium]
MATRVLLADKLDPGAFSDLEAQGVVIDNRPELTQATLPEHIGDAKVLVVRSTKVDAAAIQAAKELALIVRAGSGVNNIDVEAASRAGIYVANCPGKNSVAVAELAMGLIIALDRRIADNVSDLRAGKWDKAGYSKARGLKGQRLGLVGFGAIAQEVAQRARGFEIEVLAYARTLDEATAKRHGVTRAASLEQLFRASDIVSLHVPASATTKGLITGELMDLLPEGGMLINTSRCEVVDNDALVERAKSGRLRVGTDVFVGEPEVKAGAFEDPLGKLENVYGTHHIGASTEQAQDEIAAAAVLAVRTFLEKGDILHAVNVATQPPVQGTLVVRHHDRVGVLASLLSTLRGADINVETMENVVFEGGHAACARIRVAQRPSQAIVDELVAQEHVIAVELI